MSSNQINIDLIAEGRELVEEFLRLADDMEGYRRLACYAALPIVLTTEMLKFFRNRYVSNLSWVAEVDLLLSRLCVDVGDDLYVMNQGARAVLLEMMRDDPNLGSEKIEEVNRLLIGRLCHLVENHPGLLSEETDAYRFSAMLCVTDQRESAVSQLAARIVEQIEGASHATTKSGLRQADNRSRLRQLTRIITEHASLLDDHSYTDLIELATVTARVLNDDDGSLFAKFHASDQPDREYRLPGVDHPIRFERLISNLYPEKATSFGHKVAATGTVSQIAVTNPIPRQQREHSHGTKSTPSSKDKVFISYSTKDKETATKVRKVLVEHGIQVTIDSESLLPGQDIRAFIDQAIRETDVTLSIVSKNSLLSDWVALESVESFTAEKYLQGKKFIAGYIDDQFLNSSFLIDAVRRIDLEIDELGRLIAEETALNVDTLDLQTIKSRKFKLRNNLSEILDRLRGSLILDISEPKFETSMRRIIAEINRHEDPTEPVSQAAPGSRARRKESSYSRSNPADIFLSYSRTVRLPDGKEIQFEMVDLPGGEFQMGGTKNSDEKPIHKVRVSPFSIGKYQVTQAQWQAVMGANPSHFKGETRPVENVSWNDVQQFLRKIGNGFRLPTEAEWEYAARGGTTTEYSFGDDASKLGEYAWFRKNSGGETHPVGQKKPNPFGLYDMHGNVWEWVEDHRLGNYWGAPTDGSAWLTRDNDHSRVLRGGSWNDSYGLTRSALRSNLRPDFRDNDIGFRVVVGAQTQRGK